MSDHITVIKNNRPLRMMVVARATDQFTNACKTSAITLFYTELLQEIINCLVVGQCIQQLE